MVHKDSSLLTEYPEIFLEKTNLAVVIFASREKKSVLEKTLFEAVTATRYFSDQVGISVIDILINGNQDLVNDFSKTLFNFQNITKKIVIRLWSISFSDKAHAWNQYIKNIWSGEDIVFFMDGYVRLKNNAISLLGTGMVENADVLAGTGVPSLGRTVSKIAKTMKKNGGFHGNFCCIKGHVMSEIKSRSIKIPLGLYRVDSIMGAFIAFGLDNINNKWDHKRILVHEDATWSNDAKKWWVWKDVKAKYNQKLRQTRGIAENQAVKFFLTKEKRPVEKLPDTVEFLINNWMELNSIESKKIFRKHLFLRYAINKTLPKISLYNELETPELIRKISASEMMR